jgi:hypothetical protein
VLETVHTATVCVFDKTGTLTYGKPRVTDSKCYGNSRVRVWVCVCMWLTMYRGTAGLHNVLQVSADDRVTGLRRERQRPPHRPDAVGLLSSCARGPAGCPQRCVGAQWRGRHRLPRAGARAAAAHHGACRECCVHGRQSRGCAAATAAVHHQSGRAGWAARGALRAFVVCVCLCCVCAHMVVRQPRRPTMSL